MKIKMRFILVLALFLLSLGSFSMVSAQTKIVKKPVKRTAKAPVVKKRYYSKPTISKSAQAQKKLLENAQIEALKKENDRLKLQLLQLDLEKLTKERDALNVQIQDKQTEITEITERLGGRTRKAPIKP